APPPLSSAEPVTDSRTGAGVVGTICDKRGVIQQTDSQRRCTRRNPTESMWIFMLQLLLFICCWLSSIHALEFRYHNTVEMEQYLRQINRTFPDITHLHSIGQSVEGRELWVLILGQHPREHRPGIPEFKYAVGRVLLLQLIDYLTSRYKSDPLASNLLNSSRIHILPSMNPDGFESSIPDCINSVGRYNKNGVDLNRNFPDTFDLNSSERREKEVRAVMDWLQTETFVLSANLHGGALVASYPYDNSNGGSELQGLQSVAPDDDVFIHLAKTYSSTHSEMYKGDTCNDFQNFPNGITNGYQWYPLEGGMQDYNYVWGQCLELTLEISCCKFPPESQLPALWNANRAALLAYMRQVHLGVKGLVMDSRGKAIQSAVVTHPAYYTMKKNIQVKFGPDTFSAVTENFFLQRNNISTVPPFSSCITSPVEILVPQENHANEDRVLTHWSALVLQICVLWLMI
ncbi:hypothetical protein DNTS_031675, partial [Danionella cerebrum]